LSFSLYTASEISRYAAIEHQNNSIFTTNHLYGQRSRRVNKALHSLKQNLLSTYLVLNKLWTMFSNQFNALKYINSLFHFQSFHTYTDGEKCSRPPGTIAMKETFSQFAISQIRRICGIWIFCLLHVQQNVDFFQNVMYTIF
jgi:hypothetical protein